MGRGLYALGLAALVGCSSGHAEEPVECTDPATYGFPLGPADVTRLDALGASDSLDIGSDYLLHSLPPHPFAFDSIAGRLDYIALCADRAVHVDSAAYHVERYAQELSRGTVPVTPSYARTD